MAQKYRQGGRCQLEGHGFGSKITRTKQGFIFEVAVEKHYHKPNMSGLHCICETFLGRIFCHVEARTDGTRPNKGLLRTFRQHYEGMVAMVK